MKNYKLVGYAIIVTKHSKLYLRMRKFIIYKDSYNNTVLLRILNRRGHSCGFIMQGTVPHQILCDNYQNYILTLDTKEKDFCGDDVMGVQAGEKVVVMRVYERLS